MDDRTALLFVPFEDRMENFVVRFNPETGMILGIIVGVILVIWLLLSLIF